MTISYQHLRAFHFVAREGSVTQAARRLHVSQPTLSKQIKALEDRHQIALFEGRRTPLQLTQTGRELFELTQKMFETSDRIDQLLSHDPVEVKGMLRVGSDSPFLAAELIAAVRARHPDLQATVRMANAHTSFQLLREAQVDVAINADPPTDDAFLRVPLHRDRLGAALPFDHPMAERAVYPLRHITDDVLLSREEGSRTRSAMERLLDHHKLVPRAVLEMHTRETIREGIARGVGMSFIYERECPPDQRIVFKPLDIEGEDVHLTSYLVYPMERRRAPLTQVALQAVEVIRLSVGYRTDK
ncbi:LysR substrate-binding domain-containing protein [Woodsholea maritima]|uniref:LysR substrate-binding domain-containing protein n=1 Tax=Woodsholea maritima TaxID=240237 RepID=UPI0003793635|nr:LysR substrate-binding domain-containing protein [Woodsholea maritima]